MDGKWEGKMEGGRERKGGGERRREEETEGGKKGREREEGKEKGGGKLQCYYAFNFTLEIIINIVTASM